MQKHHLSGTLMLRFISRDYKTLALRRCYRENSERRSRLSGVAFGVNEAREELMRMLAEDELRDAVLLVFANKQASFVSSQLKIGHC
ncbi:ADP-ribosylation factor 3 [Bagarius yarrelli]|uniref:ADP-ribosylation factor 3 n=1 Tax=Bagarius yarrelli TaxID=175774 RepID=A0A556UYW4_BAGYA|nr:ADP-ribosylation factor 3 [Bagarius yarrelli]